MSNNVCIYYCKWSWIFNSYSFITSSNTNSNIIEPKQNDKESKIENNNNESENIIKEKAGISRISSTRTDELIQRICDAYASVLGLSSVEPDAEFFANGGTSLLAMQVLALLNDLDIEAKDIFSLKTPHKIAKAVQEKKAQLADLSVRISSKSEFQLLPYQYNLKHYLWI